MLSEEIQRNENLYRAIKRSNSNWLDDNNLPTSAIFKDDNGVSVDRDGNRDENDIIGFMQNISFPRRVKGIVRVSAEECFTVGANAEPAPTERNPYHANIFLNTDNIFKQNLQAHKLADACRLIFFDKEKKWTS